MKKALTLVTLLLFSFILISCSDKKTKDFDLQVVFFTGTGSTTIPIIKNLEEGQLIIAPNDPIRSGFRFEGWFKDINLTEEWDFTTDKIGDSSIALFANWIAGYYSITYDTNGGTMPSSFVPLEDYPEDQRDPETNPDLLLYLFYTVGVNNVLPRPTRTGYKFKNYYLYDEFMWEGAPENTIYSYRPGDGGYNRVPSQLSTDLELYAHWDPIKMSVTFRANYPVNGIVASNYYRNRTLTFGYDFIYDSNYDGQEGLNRLYDFKDYSANGLSYDDLEYEFIGWNSQADGTGTWFGDGTGTPGESTSLSVEYLSTLYAQWKPKNV